MLPKYGQSAENVQRKGTTDVAVSPKKKDLKSFFKHVKFGFYFNLYLPALNF